MGPIGMQEMIFIVILALLLVGPKKLPELARMLGKGMSEFRRAKSELTSTFQTHLQELERETKLEDARKNPPPPTTYSPYSYVADEYGYNGPGSNSLSEPPVDSHHSNGIASAEPAALPPVAQVAGTVPRSTLASAPENHPAHDEHPA